MLAIIVGQFNLPITIDKNVFRYFCKDATFQMLWLIHQIAKISVWDAHRHRLFLFPKVYLACMHN